MGIRSYHPSTLGIVLAAAIFAGCGGALSVAPSLPGTTAPQGHPRSHGDLLYVITQSQKSAVLVYTYPQGNFVTRFSLPDNGVAVGACSDSMGDVFIPMNVYHDAVEIAEYAHGDDMPTAVLKDEASSTDYASSNCSVDPKTGDLAVVNVALDSQSGDTVAVYKHAHGPPRFYADSQLGHAFYCAYDGEGNLFIDGSAATHREYLLAELRAHTHAFVNFGFANVEPVGQIQWDGKYVTLAYPDGLSHSIDRIAVSGSQVNVVGSTRLSGWGRKNNGTYWLQDKTVITNQKHGDLGLWRYPKGGQAYQSIKVGRDSALGETVSIDPSATRRN